MSFLRATAMGVVVAGLAAWGHGHAGPSPDTRPPLVLDVDLDPDSRHLEASAWVKPESREFRFALHRSLEVTRASADGKALQAVRIGPAGDRSVDRWQVRLPPGADRVRIEYRGTLPALDRNLGHRDVLRALPPMASSEGSFLPAGSDWYPRPGMRFAYRVNVSVPADQRAVTPGRLVSEEVPETSSGRYRAAFDFPHPADGIDLMTGPWTVRERIVATGTGAPATLRLRTYFPRELDTTAGLADAYLDDTRRYIERYATSIGPYPFAGFSIVASPLPTGLGMPTLTYLGTEVLKLPFIRATSLGHEVLHNWWGNGVLVDYPKGNWAEGLTTFMADYAYKEDESPEAARGMRLAWLRDFAAVAPDALQSLGSFRSRTHGASASVGYGKSAMLFVMLRDLIGDDAFGRGVRGFWERHRLRIASWDDVRLAFEQSSGQPLKSFFSQWLDRRGGPAVRIVEATVRETPAAGPRSHEAPAAGPKGHDARRAGDGALRPAAPTVAFAARTLDARSSGAKRLLTVRLEQGTPAYALRLPLQVVHAGGSETRWIEVTRAREEATLEVDALAAGVRLDPDLRVWRLLDREQLPPILRQWIVARTPRYVAASAGDEVRAAAVSLAERLFESPPQAIELDRIGRGGGPVLIAGLHADVDAALARAGLPPRPANLAGRGSAAVWTTADDRRVAGRDDPVIAREQEAHAYDRESLPRDEAPVAVVSANDVESLRALLRPLPHYGGQSWLVFEGGRVVDRGLWPSTGRLMPVVLQR